MSVLAITAGLTAAKMIGGAIQQKRARKKGADAEKEIKGITEAQGKELQKTTDAQVRAEQDAANQEMGMASISPEATYARNVSERNTSTAIDKAMRSGGSVSEIMNTVNAVKSRGDTTAQKLAATEAGRKRQHKTAASAHKIRAAQTAVAGKERQIGLQDKSYQMTMQKQGQINTALNQNLNYYSDALGDLASVYAYSQAGGDTDAWGRKGNEVAMYKR